MQEYSSGERLLRQSPLLVYMWRQELSWLTGCGYGEQSCAQVNVCTNELA
jgi:hypothetical protein